MTRRYGRRAQAGIAFTEVLVLMIIIAVLAAIAIPQFLGQKERAGNASAQHLARTAASVVESAYATTRDYATITHADLRAIEPTIIFGPTDNSAESGQVAVTFSANGYTVSSRSRTGRTYTLTKDTENATAPVSRTCDQGCTTW